MSVPLKQQAAVLRELQNIIQGGDAKPKTSDYASPKKFKKSKDDISKRLLEQKYDQREDILKFVEQLAAASFLFLVLVILLQMVTREFEPKYTGVSDTVINILTIGVFGQVIGIVAAITTQVWRAPKENSTKG